MEICTITLAANETSEGIICLHNVTNREDELYYEFDTHRVEGKRFSGRVEFWLQRNSPKIFGNTFSNTNLLNDLFSNDLNGVKNDGFLGGVEGSKRLKTGGEL